MGSQRVRHDWATELNWRLTHRPTFTFFAPILSPWMNLPLLSDGLFLLGWHTNWAACEIELLIYTCEIPLVSNLHPTHLQLSPTKPAVPQDRSKVWCPSCPDGLLTLHESEIFFELAAFRPTSCFFLGCLFDQRGDRNLSLTVLHLC